VKHLLLVTALLCGCTIAPAPVETKTASYSGNDQNGGFLGFLAPAAPGLAAPGHLTAGAEARYVALVKAGYATRHMIPAPGPTDGLVLLPDGTYSIDAEHLTLFGQMASDFRSGKKP
jgi:hypothetical protein